ncbi:MAG: sugar nucleotide-binding protein [Lachnospiraceae bacterium]|nr:sugar nucleotide-binding protein [Lachnospiraceae bacterium]
MRVLVTGKNGRIGCAFVEYMNAYYPQEMEIDTVSLRDDMWKDADWSCYDAILHLVGVSTGDKEYCYHINRDLSTAVAQKAKRDGVNFFIQVSTMMVYGDSAPIGQCFTIGFDTEPKPVSLYGSSKLEGERAVLKLADDSFCVAVVREPVVYGEHIDGEFRKLLKLSGYLPVFPQIDSTKSYIYEGNMCEFFRQLILGNRGGVFCPQNKERPTTSDLYAIMRKARGRKCIRLYGLMPLLKLMSHITGYVNAVFNDMKYTEELSRPEGMDYQIYSLEESIKRCLK